MNRVTFSFLPLTDAAPIIVAHECGFFKTHGVEATLRRESNWSALRNSVNSGESQAAQMLYSMPLAAACGLLGNHQEPLVIPWVMNANGQGITLNVKYRGKVAGNAQSLREAALAGRDCGRPLVFGHTLRIGTHSLWLRYWLAAGGIDPTNDVALITVPPPQMAANMKAGRMDGFCVGDPWNAKAIEDSLGYTALTSQEIWPDHPEKVCAFREDFANSDPATVAAALHALDEASRWIDEPANRANLAVLLGGPEYLNCDPALVKARLTDPVDYGDGRQMTLPHTLCFSKTRTNRPDKNHAIWFLSQFRRWGLHFGVPDYQGIASRVIRPDIFDKAALPQAGADSTSNPVTLFDGVPFTPDDPEGYARSFTIKNLQG